MSASALLSAISRRPGIVVAYVGYLILSCVTLWLVDDVAGAGAREVVRGMTPTEVLQRIIGAMMLGSAVPVWVIGGLRGDVLRLLVGALAWMNGLVGLGAGVLLSASSLTTAPILIAQGLFAGAFALSWRSMVTDQPGPPDPA